MTRGNDAHVEQQPRVRQHAQLEGRRQRQQLEGVQKVHEAREGRRRPDQKRWSAVVARRRHGRARHVREDRDAEQQLHLGQLREGAGALREAVGFLLFFLRGGWWFLFRVLVLLVVLGFSSSYGLEFVEVDVCGARSHFRGARGSPFGCVSIDGLRARNTRTRDPARGRASGALIQYTKPLRGAWQETRAFFVGFAGLQGTSMCLSPTGPSADLGQRNAFNEHITPRAKL